jgi:hypothetical protein
MRHGNTADAAARRSLMIGLKSAVVLASFAAAGLACLASAAQAPVAPPQTGRGLPGAPDSYAYETFRFDVGASAP